MCYGYQSVSCFFHSALRDLYVLLWYRPAVSNCYIMLHDVNPPILPIYTSSDESHYHSNPHHCKL